MWSLLHVCTCSKHPVRIVYLVQLLQDPRRFLERVSSCDLQTLLQDLLVQIRFSLLFHPLDFKFHYSRIVSHYISPYSLKHRVRRRLESGVVVFVVHIVANSEKLLSFIWNWNQNRSCSEDLLGRHLAKIGRVRISLKGEHSSFQVFHFELIDDLVILGIGGWAEVDDFPVEGAR